MKTILTRDPTYTVAKEGHAYVARHHGQRIGETSDKRDAWAAALAHKRESAVRNRPE